MTTEMHARALELDAVDRLAGWRDQFITDDDVAYLDGNSLGMTPRRTLDRVDQVMRNEWAHDLIASWAHWLDLPQRVGDQLAPLIGAGPGEVVVHDSTTVNLYQAVRSAARLRPGRRTIAVAPTEFPTDRYIVEAVAGELGFDVQPDFDDLSGVGVVVRSMVDYRTAVVTDIAAETERASAAGAITVWDLSHGAGLLEIELNAAGAEFAVGCTYKYLNGGPGAPAFNYVAGNLIERVEQPIPGWFSQVDQFDMDAAYAPRLDIGRMLIGTPGILGLVAAQCGIEISAEAGIERIAAKGRSITSFALDCCDTVGLDSPSPRDPRHRGGHISIRHPDAESLVSRLASEHRVIADYRVPDVIRLGCSPLTTRYRDVAVAIAAIAAAP